MKIKHVLSLCVLSGLLMLVGLLALLADNDVAAAQEPEATPIRPSSSLPPDWPMQPQGGAAQGAMNEDARAAAGTSAYLHIPGQAFTPLWSPANIYYASSGCVYITGTYKYLTHPIILPNRSHLTQLRFYYKDISDTDDGIFNLIEYDDGISSTYLYTMTTSGHSGEANFNSIDIDKTLDYQNYSYTVLWRPVIGGNSMQLCGYRLTYDAPLLGASALPLIIK